MKHTVGALLLSTFFGIPAFAAPSSPETVPINAVVQLSSARHDVCGTGFIDENGYIVTNAHLVRSLCPADDCSGLTIASAPALGAAATPRRLTTTPRIVAVLPAFDIGFIDAKLPPSPLRILGTARAGSTVSTLGFPGCKTLEYSNGRITSSNSVHLATTLSGGHGSSGSPIITESGQVVGIVDEALHLIDSLWGSSFPLRGVRLDSIGQLELGQMLPRQLERLADFRRRLADQPLSARVRGSFDLLVALDALITAAGNRPAADEAERVLARGERILAEPPKTLVDPVALVAESLTVDFALQHRLSLRAPQLLDRYRSQLENLGRSGAHLFPLPSVPTVFDLNAAVLVSFGILLLLGVFFFVRVVRFLRRSPRA